MAVGSLNSTKTKTYSVVATISQTPFRLRLPAPPAADVVPLSRRPIVSTAPPVSRLLRHTLSPTKHERGACGSAT
ncbi:hypothetical protein HPP92_013399 [Vanilla planifolia]|uniref:Uncharacterized protein n=1 Tax=Vanilla planifolia TaxID=51239 RepID=A0A835QZ01_VANPL|nr:hypothetical protein HPP92_013829 [Vanilla planifolia]KAG0478680.1 hypothetical protein HPP92_013399 [Vanilla planifolia]